MRDKYGLSWQIVRSVLGEMLQDKDAAKANRVMQAMMQMVSWISPHCSKRTISHSRRRQ
jgi:predicted 3-demethylubiquinone-9 3-methyltransferase (glyoxalase superfamily)